MARIGITGLWHQGVVLAACLAELGHEVVGLTDAVTGAALNNAQPPVHEPGLAELLRRNIDAGRLRFVDEPAVALAEVEFVYISLDTPVADDDGPILEPVYDLARTIGGAVAGDVIVCVTAQVPVGTTEKLLETIRAIAVGRQCEAAYVPEFLRLGDAISTFRNADRFAIGADEPTVAQRVAALYVPLGRPVIVTDIRSAELAKHAANAFLALSISFANEVSDIAVAIGADFDQAAEILRLDRRIGRFAFLTPGLGYAGGTLGRELRVLQGFGNEHGVPTRVIDAVVAVNDARAEVPRRRLRAALGSLDGRRVALLGLTYKPGTSTLRRALSLKIARDLIAHGVTVTGFDPLADFGGVSDAPPIEIAADPYAAVSGADAAILITEWEGVDNLDLDRLAHEMRGRFLFDTRGVLDRRRVNASGLEYVRL